MEPARSTGPECLEAGGLGGRRAGGARGRGGEMGGAKSASHATAQRAAVGVAYLLPLPRQGSGVGAYVGDLVRQWRLRPFPQATGLVGRHYPAVGIAVQLSRAGPALCAQESSAAQRAWFQ